MKKNTMTPQIFKTIYLIIVIVLSAIYVHAQTDPGNDPGNAPIDGGLSLLIAAGVGYGAKKIRDKKKQQEEEANK